MSTAATDAGTTLVVTRTIKATPERVFDAWTSPEEMKRWKAPGAMAPGAIAVDLRVGGQYRVSMVAPDGAERTVTGTYRVVERPRLLVYTWQWETSPGFPETLVTVDFKAVSGGTELRITHTGLPDADSNARHNQGWTGSLDKLETLFT